MLYKNLWLNLWFFAVTTFAVVWIEMMKIDSTMWMRVTTFAVVWIEIFSLAKEGLDIPRLDRLYMTTPKKDYSVVTQSVGRIARTAEGKGEAVCYDYVDDIAFCVNQYQKRRTHYRRAGCIL